MNVFSGKFPYHPPLARKDCRKQILHRKTNLVQLNNTIYALGLYSFSFCTDSTGGGVTNAYWHSTWHRGNSWRRHSHEVQHCGVARCSSESWAVTFCQEKEQATCTSDLSLSSAPCFSPQAGGDIFGLHYLLTDISTNGCTSAYPVQKFLYAVSKSHTQGSSKLSGPLAYLGGHIGITIIVE